MIYRGQQIEYKDGSIFINGVETGYSVDFNDDYALGMTLVDGLLLQTRIRLLKSENE